MDGLPRMLLLMSFPNKLQGTSPTINRSESNGKSRNSEKILHLPSLLQHENHQKSPRLRNDQSPDEQHYLPRRRPPIFYLPNHLRHGRDLQDIWPQRWAPATTINRLRTPNEQRLPRTQQTTPENSWSSSRSPRFAITSWMLRGIWSLPTKFHKICHRYCHISSTSSDHYPRQRKIYHHHACSSPPQVYIDEFSSDLAILNMCYEESQAKTDLWLSRYN